MPKRMTDEEYLSCKNRIFNIEKRLIELRQQLYISDRDTRQKIIKECKQLREEQEREKRRKRYFDYTETNQKGKWRTSVCYQYFGKRPRDLTPDEFRAYRRLMYKISKEKGNVDSQ